MHKNLGSVILCFGSLLFLGIGSRTCWGQASLASEDTLSEQSVTIDGVPESFTLIRDAVAREQWYYVPNQVRLFERQFAGVTEPEFSLLRYQFPDPANTGNFLEGGILQFAATLAVPPDGLSQLKQIISSQIGVNADALRLSSLPN
jgi:hypothetical protein